MCIAPNPLDSTAADSTCGWLSKVPLVYIDTHAQLKREAASLALSRGEPGTPFAECLLLLMFILYGCVQCRTLICDTIHIIGSTWKVEVDSCVRKLGNECGGPNFARHLICIQYNRTTLAALRKVVEMFNDSGRATTSCRKHVVSRPESFCCISILYRSSGGVCSTEYIPYVEYVA